MSPPLLIVGFHRSGTSAVARMFHHAGVDLGERLLGAEPANPYGHYEDVDAVTMHDEFLERGGDTWKSADAARTPLDAMSRDALASYIARRDDGGLWGVKDPRLCLYLDEWLRARADANVVVVIRRPGDAISSLHMRHSRRHVDIRGADSSDVDFWRDPDLGVKLWIRYHESVLACVEASNGPLVVDFADRGALSRLVAGARERWDLPLTTDDPVLPDPRLGNTAQRPIEIGSPALIDRAADVWSSLQRLVNVT